MSTGFSADERGGSGSDYNRPRRPNVDTIAYLRGLPLDIEQSKSEVEDFLHNNQEFPQTLAAAFSAIDEIRNEIASLAGDEFGSQALEVIAHVSAPYSEVASRVFLSACSGYHLHLATHRYGSHVIQSILQLAVSSSSESDLALHEDAPQFSVSVEDLPSLSDLIFGMVEELRPSASQLAIHVCGSHVLRTLLCIMGGVNLVSSTGPSNENKLESGAILRGRKKSKKKKKRQASSDETTVPHAGTMRVVYRKNIRIIPQEFTATLEEFVLSLIGEPSSEPGELQQLACHASAGPLLIVLLRVLTYATESGKKFLEGQSDDIQGTIADFRLGVSRPEPKFEPESIAHEMVKRLLCWDDDSNEQKHTGDVIYGFSGEPRGSHLLETLLRLSPDDIYGDIVKYGDFENPQSLQDYAEHDVSNFVIQTLLMTTRTKENAEILLKAIDKVIANGLAIDASKKRRGILWRACELAAKFRVGQESLLKSIRLGFGSLQTAPDVTEGKKKKQRKKASAIDFKDCVRSLINLKTPGEGSGRITLDAAGTRSVYHLLRFSPRLCEETLLGIIDGHTKEELEFLARDGLSSRCILDGILDGPTQTPIFSTAAKSLLDKVSGRWVALSTDRVGNHTVKKLFKALPKIDDKAKLVEELVLGGNRLSGNTMGRSVVDACMVNEYNDNRKDWRKAVAKSLSREENFIDEISQLTPKGLDDIIPGTKTKRKRKRKRAEKAAVEGDEGTAGSKPRMEAASIIHAITMESTKEIA